jgi:hypothetical protein
MRTTGNRKRGGGAARAVADQRAGAARGFCVVTIAAPTRRTDRRRVFASLTAAAVTGGLLQALDHVDAAWQAAQAQVQIEQGILAQLQALAHPVG